MKARGPEAVVPDLEELAAGKQSHFGDSCHFLSSCLVGIDVHVSSPRGQSRCHLNAPISTSQSVHRAPTGFSGALCVKIKQDISCIKDPTWNGNNEKWRSYCALSYMLSISHTSFLVLITRLHKVNALDRSNFLPLPLFSPSTLSPSTSAHPMAWSSRAPLPDGFWLGGMSRRRRKSRERPGSFFSALSCFGA